jgi:hypothetical protein
MRLFYAREEFFLIYLRLSADMTFFALDRVFKMRYNMGVIFSCRNRLAVWRQLPKLISAGSRAAIEPFTAKILPFPETGTTT